jgi:hypothetical protein
MLNCTAAAVVLETTTWTDVPPAIAWIGMAKLPTPLDTSNDACAANPTNSLTAIPATPSPCSYVPLPLASLKTVPLMSTFCVMPNDLPGIANVVPTVG